MAHLDEERTATLPFLDLVLSSVMFFHEYLLRHENEGNTYTGLPHDPAAYHADCAAEGQRHYATNDQRMTLQNHA